MMNGIYFYKICHNKYMKMIVQLNNYTNLIYLMRNKKNGYNNNTYYL